MIYKLTKEVIFIQIIIIVSKKYFLSNIFEKFNKKRLEYYLNIKLI